MDDITSQYLMSLINPPVGTAKLRTYFRIIAKALGVRNDAGLGSVLGIPATTIANWKRRGGVPPDSALLIRTTLIEKVATYTRDLPKVGLESREAVVRFMVATGGNPLLLRGDPATATALALPGLFSLAEMLWELQAVHGQDANGRTVAELLPEAMFMFRHGDQFRPFTHLK